MSPDETFCIYCQRKFSAPRYFKIHMKAKHQGTYAHSALLAALEPNPTSTQDGTDTTEE